MRLGNFKIYSKTLTRLVVYDESIVVKDKSSNFHWKLLPCTAIQRSLSFLKKILIIRICVSYSSRNTLNKFKKIIFSFL